MESILYICRLCLKAFRSHGWALRHEEACIGAMQVVMLDGPQIRLDYRSEMMESAAEPRYADPNSTGMTLVKTLKPASIRRP